MKAYFPETQSVYSQSHSFSDTLYFMFVFRRLHSRMQFHQFSLGCVCLVLTLKSRLSYSILATSSLHLQVLKEDFHYLSVPFSLKRSLSVRILRIVEFKSYSWLFCFKKKAFLCQEREGVWVHSLDLPSDSIPPSHFQYQGFSRHHQIDEEE